MLGTKQVVSQLHCFFGGGGGGDSLPLYLLSRKFGMCLVFEQEVIFGVPSYIIFIFY